jgi:hypothetical protein
MIFRLIVCLSVVIAFSSCNNGNKKPLPKTVQKSIIPKKDSAKKLNPVPGYRFNITGDFNGDGKKEQLTEHFFSKLDHKETNKFYENGDYDTLIALTAKKKPYCFLSCSDKSIGNLNIDGERQVGLAYLKNEGDLNGDGTDEVSYVVDWTDLSNLNWWEIMTYKDGKWKKLYTFNIWDWQLPDLPETFNQYGPFGLQNKSVNTKDLAANKKIEEDLKSFPGLVKKIADNKIQIMYMTDEAELDTAIVDLNRPSKKPKSIHKMR